MSASHIELTWMVCRHFGEVEVSDGSVIVVGRGEVVKWTSPSRDKATKVKKK